MGDLLLSNMTARVDLDLAPFQEKFNTFTRDMNAMEARLQGLSGQQGMGGLGVDAQKQEAGDRHAGMTQQLAELSQARERYAAVHNATNEAMLRDIDKVLAEYKELQTVMAQINAAHSSMTGMGTAAPVVPPGSTLMASGGVYTPFTAAPAPFVHPPIHIAPYDDDYYKTHHRGMLPDHAAFDPPVAPTVGTDFTKPVAPSPGPAVPAPTTPAGGGDDAAKAEYLARLERLKADREGMDMAYLAEKRAAAAATRSPSAFSTSYTPHPDKMYELMLKGYDTESAAEMAGLPSPHKVRGSKLGGGEESAWDEENHPLLSKMFEPASRGGPSSELYQKYQFRYSPQAAPVLGAVGELPGGGKLTELLSMLAGPEVAATVAATAATGAFVEGMKKATEAAMDYANSQNSLMASIGVGPSKPLSTEMLAMVKEQVEANVKLGIMPNETKEAAGAAFGMGATPAQEEKIMEFAKRIAATNQMSLVQAAQNATSMVLFGTGGGAFQKLLGREGVREGSSFEEANVAANKTLIDPGQIADTAPGLWKKIQAEFASTWEEIGIRVLPPLTNFLRGLDDVVGRVGIGLKVVGAGIDMLPSMANVFFYNIKAGLSELPGMGYLKPSQEESEHAAADLGRIHSIERRTAKDIAKGMVPQGAGGFQTPENPGAGDAGAVGNTLSQLTVMRQVTEQITDSTKVIEGIQSVFSKLVVFHVDWKLVKPQLENLKDAIVHMGDWWYEVAREAGQKMNPADYQDKVKPWLEMMNAASSLMSSSSDMFTKMYTHAGLMPDEGAQKVVEDRLKQLFVFFKGVSHDVYANASLQETQDLGNLQAFATLMKTVTDFVGGGTDALTKIYSMPIPDEGKVAEVGKHIGGFVKGISKELVAALTDDTGTTSPDVTQAMALTAPAGQLMGIITSGVGIIEKMRNLAIPSEGEVRQVAHLSASMIPAIVDEFKAALTSGGKETDAATLQALGEKAENANKLLSLAMSGVGIMAGMRNLEIPDAGRLGQVISATMGMTAQLVASLPRYDANTTTDIKVWGESFGPVMGVVSNVVGILAGMRNLAMPSHGMISRAISGVIEIAQDIFAATQRLDANSAVAVQRWGDSFGPVMSAISTAVDVEQKIRDLRPPNQGEIKQAVHLIIETVNDMSAEFNSTSQTAADNAGDWGRGMGAMFGALNSGADYIQKTRDILLPTQQHMDDITKAVLHIGGMAGRGMGPDQAKSIEDQGKAMTAMFGALKEGETVIQDMLKTPRVSEKRIADLFTNIDEISSSFAKHAAKMEGRGDLHMAKFGDDIEKMLAPIKTAEDVINGVGVIRFDYTAPIDLLFDNMDLMVTQFAVRGKSWKENLSAETLQMAKVVSEEMGAISAAIDPISKMELAARVSPMMIDKVINLMEYTVHRLADMVKMPEFQGENLAEMQAVANTIGSVFDPIGRAVSTIQEMSKPTSTLTASNTLSIMGRTAAQAGGMARIGGAVAGGAAGGGAGTNIYINGVMIGGDDGAVMARILTQHIDVKNGGMPVNAKPVK